MSLTEQERQELIGYLPPSIAESARLDAWISGGECRVSRQYFGKAYVYALSLMVSHKATLEGQAAEGHASPVSQIREGDISVSYGNGNGNGNGDLSATSYGQEFLSLLAQYRRAPNITLGPCIGGLDGGDRIQSLF